MNKPKITMTISIFAVCIVLVAVLMIQFKIVEKVNETDIENLRESELREQLSMLKSKYEEINEKLEEINAKITEYNTKIQSNEESLELLDDELLQSNILLGNTDVTGEGVIVTLADTNEAIITASDLLELVNELRFAGAEAISINDVRITALTDIVDISNRFILIKPGQRLSSPYVVKAIGNQTYLASSLNLKNSGYIDIHSKSGQSVKIETQRSITIPKYTGEFSVKYLKEVSE